MKASRRIAVSWIGLVLSLAPVFAKDPLPSPSHRVMLLGTFHFEDAGLDDYKPEFNVDVLSEQRQQEIAEVVSVLETFRPTKIAVEQPLARQGWLDERYDEYVGGTFELPADEIFQLGFRLARRLGHSGVHAIDAERRRYEPYVDPEEYAIEHGQRELVESPWYEWYREMAQEEDRLKTRMTIGEYLLHLNRPERIRKAHGIYLVGTFKAGSGDEYPGADGKTAWYNRNLRIFSNIQRITRAPEERILVIIGAGHLPILRHCVDASPEYELVEPASLVEGSAHDSIPAIDGAALLRAHTYELDHRAGLSGPGLDFLVRETVDAQFVLLGEPHNTNQVNEFTGRLFEALSTAHGFDHLVTEQDALMMDRFARPGTRGDLDGIRSVANDYPDALHFFTDGELALHAQIGRLSRAEHPLWGVDRIHDAALAFEALLGTDVPADDRRHIRSLLEDLRRDRNGRSVSAESALFDDLLQREYEAGSRAAQIVHALTISREDFRAYETEHDPGDPWGFIANERREELMKTRFIQNYRRALAARGDTLPKAIAKLGHWHVMRGRNPGRVPTLGSFMVEVARFNGMGAISISIQPVNEPGRHWSITDYEELAPLTLVADSAKWQLVDLRPLRGYIHSGALRVSKLVEETVFGFDLLLLMGGTDKGKATWAE